jgi:hypothetical protein
VEIKKISVQDQHWQKVSETPISINKSWAWCAAVIPVTGKVNRKIEIQAGQGINAKLYLKNT